MLLNSIHFNSLMHHNYVEISMLYVILTYSTQGVVVIVIPNVPSQAISSDTKLLRSLFRVSE